MRRTALWILAIAGGLTGLVLLAVAIAVATVDPKTLIGPVQARVKADTGRDLAFGGPVELKLSLEPKVVASDVTLSNAQWGQSPQIVKAKRVEVQVALLPLLQKRFEVVEVALVEPTIALETDAQGRANWDFGGTAAVTGAPPPPTSTAAVIIVGNIAIRDGTLTYRDGATGKTTNVAIERLALRSRSPDAPVNAEFKGRIDGVALAVSGNLGPLDALRERRWPYPVALKGDVDSKPANVSTKIAIRDDTATLDPLDLNWGTLSLKGNLSIAHKANRTRYTFDLSSPSLSLADAGIAGAAAAGAKPASAAPSPFVISDRPLPLDAFRTIDFDGALAIGELVIDERNRLRALKLKVANARGRLEVPAVQAAAYGGTLTGRLTIDAAGTGAPPVHLRIDGRDLDLEALLTAIGEKRQVRGGKTALTLDLATRGGSLHAWAASATGQAQVTIGPATLVNTRLDANDVLDTLAGAVNPWRARDPSTELVCAVIRLPLADGIARVDRSIAMETKQIGVSASGILDLRSETLDFKLRPRVREGIPLDIPTFAELVSFKGPFRHPVVAVDAARSAETIAKLGAAIYTGGLSVLGTSLLAKASAGGGECEVALGRQPAAAKPAPPAGEAPAATGKVGNEIGKALGKLFGK